jgi:glycosyltransferase involved in cell wall biosynthesis
LSTFATPSVEVLLATHNGARYLPALLDSLFDQSYAHFTIVIRDDRSEDHTNAIVAEYAAKYPARIKVLPPPQRQSGAAANFQALVAAAEADFVFFCDQDDVWFPHKMAISYNAMERLVEEHGPEHPLLVHTDLAVVGAGLELLGPSLYKYAGFDARSSDLRELLLSNVVTGCTILVNRALYKLAGPVPEEAVMYDHWFAQVAAALGKIKFLDEPTILYRQHGRNVVGVKPAGLLRFLRNAKRTFLSNATYRVLLGYSDQARILLERYGERLSSRQRREIAALATVWSKPRLKRYAKLRNAGLGKRRFDASVALFLLLLRQRPPECHSRSGAHNKG